MLTEKRKAYLIKWRTNNKDKIKASQKRYYEANRKKCLAACSKWVKENREAYLERRRRYYANNSAKDIERVRRRRGRIKQALSFMNQAEQAEVQGMYDFCRMFKGFEVDHVIPLNGKTVSGLHVLSNLRVVPMLENRSKSNKAIYL